MASLGTPTFFLHPAEALHGDLGMVGSDDVVIAISNSGESEEILRILPNIKMIGASLIALTTNPDSTMVRHCDYAYVFPSIKEACSMDLAPTSSTTSTLVFGDALAIVLSRLAGFKESNYALFHPAGSLGKKLLMTVRDLMVEGTDNASVLLDATLKHAIVEMGAKALNLVNIVSEEGALVGVLTDGDIRRLLENEVDLYSSSVDQVMTRGAVSTSPDILAIDALNMMKDGPKNITAMPVLEEGQLVGTIRLYDIVKAGVL